MQIMSLYMYMAASTGAANSCCMQAPPVNRETYRKHKPGKPFISTISQAMGQAVCKDRPEPNLNKNLFTFFGDIALY